MKLKTYTINVKKIASGNKKHTTDTKMGVSVLLRLFISSNEVYNSDSEKSVKRFIWIRFLQYYIWYLYQGKSEIVLFILGQIVRKIDQAWISKDY